MTDAVDWDLAARRAARLARPGPTADREELSALVASLRTGAVRAPEFVGTVTDLTEAAERTAAGPVYVIDRPRWSAGNLAMLRHLVGDLMPVPKGPGGPRFAAEELGALLSLLSSRVLGQYDPFTPPSTGTEGDGTVTAGRLVLVAPNILHVQRQLNLRAADFHLWVCLHEQTHALQFAAAPWLADHMRTRMRELMATLLVEEDAASRMRDLIGALPRVLRGDGEPATASAGGALLGAVLTEAEQEAMDASIAVMSLLEGHADVVMDAVGPRVVPTVRTIRKSFEARRAGQGFVDTLLRRVLGLDAKLAQYREGAAFVRAVVAKVGHPGLNAVWAAPEHLPSAAEIADPAAWVRRVHG
ncbi:zinc-dependent metalloprotease [Occultella glacieicola]|uniref:zinc-dependent metalloprotease n=1 Tax=Occultella glacieicola TaxID=2518684 RepID=UPI001F3D4717|nr:zinc-dependent metalloprotease [Occultella glacieicola]